MPFWDFLFILSVKTFWDGYVFEAGKLKIQTLHESLKSGSEIMAIGAADLCVQCTHVDALFNFTCLVIV
jgi:hypothetical protein